MTNGKNYWVTGFIEGEGCFSCGINKSVKNALNNKHVRAPRRDWDVIINRHFEKRL